MSSDFVATRSARLKKNAQNSFVTVEYIAHKKKIPVPKDKKADRKQDTKESLHETDRDRDLDPRKKQELEMKRARYDVIKLGMSSLSNVEARKAKIAKAIALGARPPKNRRSNYKKLKDDRRTAKETASRRERISGADKSLSKCKAKKKPREKDTGLLGVYGTVQKGPART